jgi:hypothetical protein
VIEPRRMRYVGACSMHERGDKCTPIDRDRCRWDDCTQIDIRVVRCDYETGFIWLKIGTFGWLI